MITAQARADLPLTSPPAPPASHWNDVSLDGYRKHLLALKTLVENCANVRDMKACDPTMVGLDDRVPVQVAAMQGSGGERRLVRYGWLRVLLSKAQDKDVDEASAGDKKAASEEGVRPPRPTTTQLLKDAEIRLEQDVAESTAATATAPAHDRARAAMNQVLASREFPNLEQTAKDTTLEKLGTWLNQVFEGAARLTAHSAWVGRTIVWGFIVAVCVGLAWGLIQLERRGRIRLAPESGEPGAGAASARDWQLWLEDARKAAAAGQWREAVHFVYWAAISRLEARRLWPADRARTPREYLALVVEEDPRREGLRALTLSFERIWYGGRPANEDDYRSAEQLAQALIAGSGTSGGAAQ
jgi:hypothetical protein